MSKRYELKTDSPDRWRYYRLAAYLLGFALAGLGVVWLEVSG